MCEGDVIGGFIAGVCFTFLITVLVLMGSGTFNGEEELGQSICDQEYNMNYDKYVKGELYCKDKQIKEKYDGIKIVIKEGDD